MLPASQEGGLPLPALRPGGSGSADKIAVSFDLLVISIRQAHEELTAQASRAVNASLTLRNWLIGFYIAEYEQKGIDRAQYGDRLLDRLSGSLLQAGVSRAEVRELRRYRQFYITYPQIRESLTPELKTKLLANAGRAASNIGDSPTPELMIPAQEIGIFVSKYLLELPKKEEMQRFIEEQLADAMSPAVGLPEML